MIECPRMSSSSSPIALSGWALVLGASSGFGEATSLTLARAGLNVFGVHLDRRATLPIVERIVAKGLLITVPVPDKPPKRRMEPNRAIDNSHLRNADNTATGSTQRIRTHYARTLRLLTILQIVTSSAQSALKRRIRTDAPVCGSDSTTIGGT